MNLALEKEKSSNWIAVEKATMDIGDIVRCAIQGHIKCDVEEPCLSRGHSGDYACKCIRSVFPSDEHYQLYEELRILVMAIELLEEVEQGEFECNNNK